MAATQDQLIAAMKSRGHDDASARAVIAGRSGDSLQNLYNEYGFGSQSASGGGSAVNTTPYDNLLNNQPSALEFAKTQEAKIDDAFKQYAMVARAQKKPLDVYSEFESGAGLPAQRKLQGNMRKQIFDLEDTINRQERIVKGTTRESLVTESQREQLVTARQQPLIEQLTKLTRDYSNISQSISELRSDLALKAELYLKGQEQELEPYKLNYQALTDQAARLQSAFGIDSQNKLEISLAKIRRGEELDDRERDEAYSLLQTETEYLKSLKTAAAAAGASVTGDDTADSLLRKIGEQAAADIAWQRRNTSGGTVDTSKYYGSGSSAYVAEDSGLSAYVVE